MTVTPNFLAQGGVWEIRETYIQVPGDCPQNLGVSSLPQCFL